MDFNAMPAQFLFNAMGAIAAFLAGWWVKVIRELIWDLQKDNKALVDRMSSIEVLVANQYVKRENFEKTMDSILTKLDRIADKLEQKADKGSDPTFPNGVRR